MYFYTPSIIDFIFPRKSTRYNCMKDKPNHLSPDFQCVSVIQNKLRASTTGLLKPPSNDWADGRSVTGKKNQTGASNQPQTPRLPGTPHIPSKYGVDMRRPCCVRHVGTYGPTPTKSDQIPLRPTPFHLFLRTRRLLPPPSPLHRTLPSIVGLHTTLMKQKSQEAINPPFVRDIDNVYISREDS